MNHVCSFMAKRSESGKVRRIALPLLALSAAGVLGFLLWRMSLPWRILKEASPTEANWSFGGNSLQTQPVRWTDGSLVLIATAATAEIHWLDLIRNGSINLIRVLNARVEFNDAPERFQKIDFSPWKTILEPSALPLDKVDLSGTTLKLSIFPKPLDADITAIRHRSGAIDSTARISGGGLTVQGFLRLGWDSLENGGSFEGSYARREDGYFFSFFEAQPFRSFLEPFRDIQFEGSFVLDKAWKFDQGVRLITSAIDRAAFGNETLHELAFSGATVFPDRLTREERAILEGLMPDQTSLFRVEARRRGDGPIIIRTSINRELFFELDADSWRDQSPARLKRADTDEVIVGSLLKAESGGLKFLPDGKLAQDLVVFNLPGILEVHFDEVENPPR